jgi:hypothetical protein
MLAHLEPINVGTPYVESLSGYISRLALEHFITPHHLMSKIVALVTDKSTINNRSASGNHGRAINGLGNISADLVAVFEKLTLRNDLRFTTMLTWAEVLPNMHLIRQHRAWCAACYEDWRASKQIIYDPLIWAITPLIICPKHRRYLESNCIHCNSQFHHLFNRMIPGHCPKCRSWLGVAPNRSHTTILEGELRWQSWVHDNVGALLAEAPKVVTPPTRTHIEQAISNLINTLDLHQYRDLMTSLNVPSGTFDKWRKGRNLPHLSWLLQLCYRMKVPLVDVLCQKVVLDKAVESTDHLGTEINKQNRYKNRYMTIDHDQVEKQLIAASIEFPPRPLYQVASQIGYSISKLKNRFPQLCQIISTNRKQYKTRPFDLKNAKKIIRSAIKEIPPPSLEGVYRRLGGMGEPDPIRKHFPKESRIILDRYKASRMKPFDIDKITAELKAAIKGWPPCSRERFAEINNVNPYVLYRKLPHLCKELAERYRIYRELVRAEEHEKTRNEARRVGMELHSKGQYPSLARIKANLTIPSILFIIREVSKELVRELGYG